MRGGGARRGAALGEDAEEEAALHGEAMALGEYPHRKNSRPGEWGAAWEKPTAWKPFWSSGSAERTPQAYSICSFIGLKKPLYWSSPGFLPIMRDLMACAN